MATPQPPTTGNTLMLDGAPIYLPSAENRRLINVYSVRAPKYTFAMRLFRLITALIALFFGVIMVISIVYPRFEGYVTVGMPDDSMKPTYSWSDEMVYQKVRVKTAGDLQPGQVIVVQPDANPNYHVTRIVSAQGQGENRVYHTRLDSRTQEEPTPITVDKVRGKLVYRVPYMGTLQHLTAYTTRSVLIVLISLALLCLAGWYIGTGLINRRDPAAQARAARLQASAYAGKVAATRSRMQRQRMAGK